MSTQKKTTTTGTFAGLGTAHTLQGAASPVFTQGVQNPFGSATYNAMANTGSAGLNALSSGVSRAQANNNRQMAVPPSPALLGAQNRDNQFASMRLGGQMSDTLQMGALNSRNALLGGMSAFRPLQTGGTQTESVTGAGTWAGPLIGGLVSAGMGMIPGGGGAASAFKRLQSGAMQGSQQASQDAIDSGQLDSQIQPLDTSSPYSNPYGNAVSNYNFGGSSPYLLGGGMGSYPSSGGMNPAYTDQYY